MGRLHEPPSRLAKSPASVSRAPDVEVARAGGRVEAAWRAWYKTRRWQKLRLQVFERDGYRCQRSGVLCLGKHPAGDSPVANHKRPHRGDEALFWDIENIETVTKAVHDGEIQREEQASLVTSGTWY